ncbi:HD-GYP domain-containing protein [Acidaminobacter sp. JC074]|uniref:HD-GYP domain-containing protein n=1 Tax=Acidaminobacter sp. JC074 TaxID=2530199 RepID=UPI001F0E024B|nr:HD-GYP domain-containing protein [Acidaminobacter sp. JC074]MCH4888626.1 HD-GYP domain-containing protein [Acidaminobacter sp. JC074]
MRAIPTKYVREGSVLGENLYTASGQVLLKANTVLSANLIYKINDNKIYTIYVKDEHSDYEVNRLLEQSFRVKGMLLIKELFTIAQDDKHVLDLHDKLSEYADDVLYELKSSQDQFIEYIDVKNVDIYIYSSSLNVALLSSLIAWKLGYNDEMVKHVFLGAIYHDIGIALLPNDVINKTTELTRDEKLMILNHPNRGYQFVKDKTYLSAYIKQIVLQHHECIDGSGYPQRLSGEDISEIAQIVGIADIYDAMTSDRPYKRAVAPNEALEYILGSNTKFNPKVVEAFIKHIVPYPKGALVELSNGEIGVIDEIHPHLPLRPKIRVIHKVKKGYDYEKVDLEFKNNLVINRLYYDMI